MKLTGLTSGQIQKIMAYFSEEYETTFWGEKYTVKPCVIEKIHGDGMQVVHVTPIDTRPNYYVMRIDSSIDFDSDDQGDSSLNEDDKKNYGTVLELLLQYIEEEHDSINRYKELECGKYIDPYEKDAEPFEYEFPMLSWGGGMYGKMTDCSNKLNIK